jgi:Dolichyl-phosphate-mannose-protein mannosyltransferase
VCATNVALGWHWGYHKPSAYLLFWLLAALALSTSWNIVSRLSRSASRVEAGLRSAVVLFAIVTLCGLTLGWLGHLTIAGYVAAQSALFLGSWLLPTDDVKAFPEDIDRLGLAKTSLLPPAWIVGIAGALAAFAVTFAMAHSPLTLYDSISYHLFFASRWIQDHALSIVPTPFSDEAQAYAPANGELFFVWLMLPFHGDLLARLGQFPFALFASATLYVLARRLGASPQHAIYPAAFFALSRPILEQAIGANVDLICAAMFLASVYFGLVALERNERRDWIFWGLCLGLYGGSKYLALVFAPTLLLLAVIRGPRVRMLWASLGVAVFALPWYARNWIVAGSPIYPASLRIAGFTLARGAFDRSAMLNTVFHTTDVRLLPVMAAHGLGPTLFLVWLPIALVGGIGLIRRGWWPHGFLFLMPYLMVPLYWFGSPVNIDSRFLMSAIAPALLPFAFSFGANRQWNGCVHAVYVAAMAWILTGTHAEIRATLPWFMSDWLSLVGLLTPPFVTWFAALAVVLGAAWRLGPSRTRWALPFAVCLVALPTTALALGDERWCGPSPCEYLDATSPHIRLHQLMGWQYVAEHVQRATIAYTGTNLPYPLTGTQLTNRVVYVNIDGPARWRFHDYDRAYRARRFEPVPPLLATSSGELMPVPQRPGPRDDAARPRYERMQGFREGWIDNLKRLGVDYLFVTTLSLYEIDYVWHNSGGFPIEDEWAANDPQAFHIVYENQLVRMYAVDVRAGAR